MNAEVVEPPIQTGNTSIHSVVSQDAQPQLTDAMVSTTLGVGTRPKVPKMKPSREISTGQVGKKSPLSQQQQKWAAVLLPLQNIVTSQTNQ